MGQLCRLPQLFGPENSLCNFIKRHRLLAEGWEGHWPGCNEHRGLCCGHGGSPGDLL